MWSSEHSVLAKARPSARCVLVIVLATFALTISLATRTFCIKVPHGVSAKSNSAQAIRQHMDRDAAPWVGPVPVLTALQPPTFYPHIAPAGPLMPGTLFDESSYNRPPPSC